MPTVINTNLASLFAQNSLTNAQNNLAQSVQRLSSGLRINSAKDDAAGLAIAQLMQSNINGVNQSIRNMSDATNLLQTADTGLATVQDMLLRMKQLSVQGYDGSLSAAQKINIVTELKDLNAEINATAKRTTFNNITLLGSAQGVDSATGDLFAGQFLTKSMVIDNPAESAVGTIFDKTNANLSISQNTEEAEVVFTGLGDGQTITLGGLTFIANGTATASYVAAAFKGLTEGITAAEANSANGLRETATITFSGNATGTGSNTYSNILSSGNLSIAVTTGDTASAMATALAAAIEANENSLYDATSSAGTVTLVAKVAGPKAAIGEVADAATTSGAPSMTTKSGYFASGTLEGYDTDNVVGTTVTFTSKATNINVQDLELSESDTGAVTSITINQGSNISASTVASYDIIGNPNSDAYRMLPGVYTFNSNGNQLTLSTTINGQYRTQTLTVRDALADMSMDNETNQDLDFTDFGIRLKLSTTVDQGEQTISGETIAKIIDGEKIDIAGQSAKISNVNVANARAGTYKFTNDGNNLNVSYDNLVNDDFAEETIDLASVVGADDRFLQGNTYRIEFKSMGVSMDIYAYQDMDLSDIADLIADSDNFGLGGGVTGQLNVTEGAVGALKFQSGPNSDSFIQINTLNIRTDSNSSNLAMREVGSVVSRLSGLGVSSDTDDWQDAFMDMDSAVESAQVYISQERAVFGSQMNRIGYLSTNLTAQSTNLQNSRSSIIDTDFASETAKLTRGQIMQQAATAMLAQANQMPNVVLSLLK